MKTNCILSLALIVYFQLSNISIEPLYCHISCNKMYDIIPGATAVTGLLLWGSSPSLDYVLDDVKCFGNERKLLDCHSSPVLSHNCLHTEEAGVTCHGEWL